MEKGLIITRFAMFTSINVTCLFLISFSQSNDESEQLNVPLITENSLYWKHTMAAVIMGVAMTTAVL